MDYTDYTLTSPLASNVQAQGPVLCLTIVWHPDSGRIGEQHIVGETVRVSRYLPLFQRPGQEQAALGYGGISRESLLIKQDQQGNLEIHPPTSRMAVELNGVEVQTIVNLSREKVAAGAMLCLGRAVILCLHWMRCLPKDNSLPGLLGVGDAAIRMRELARQAAATDDTVLLLGETGTGKEVMARAIHSLSVRSERALVTVNMAALNESLGAAELFGAARGAYTGAVAARPGLFAEASRATLFLDEIGNAPASLQPMLLRVLETGDYRPLGAGADLSSSARVIAATDQNLYAETFNQALLRRLESFVIRLPPLRDRREDIGVLLLHLITGHPAKSAFTPQLASKFANYDWPGNVRQLRHVARRCLLALQLDETPDFDSLLETRIGVETASAQRGTAPAVAPRPAVNSRKNLATLSEEDVLRALHESGWQIQGAAARLGISRPSMYKLIDANTQIRQAGAIPMEEIIDALKSTGGSLEACADLLKTPSEALRQRLRALNLGS